MAVGDYWFERNCVQRVVISSSVRTLGTAAFAYCAQLHEVTFESSFHLEIIGQQCFVNCSIERITIPKSVRRIESDAFCDCQRLASLCFEEGSLLDYVG